MYVKLLVVYDRVVTIISFSHSNVSSRVPVLDRHWSF